MRKHAPADASRSERRIVRGLRARTRRLRRTLESQLDRDRFDPALSQRLDILHAISDTLAGWDAPASEHRSAAV